MTYMISASKLVKIYENNVIALDNVSFDISRKSVLMVVGPNGAGKTTLLRILSTALLPTSGEAYVLGFDIVKEAEEIRKRAAIVPQDSYPDPYLTPQQFISWYLVSRGMSISESRRQARYALEVLQLEDVRNRKCITLSGGERKRVIVAAVIAANAEFLILDEPTAGLDPIGRKTVYEVIRELGKERGIAMSTHLISEAEDVAEDVLIINKGNILAVDSVKKLMQRAPEYSYDVIVREAISGIEACLKDSGFKFSREESRILIHVKDSKELHRAVSVLSEQKLAFTVKKVSLEDVFIKLCQPR